MQCKNCGTENLEGSFFCENCGAQIAQTRYCRFCGGTISFETGCCTKCKRDRDGKKRGFLGGFGEKAGVLAKETGSKVAKGAVKAAHAVAGAAAVAADKTKEQIQKTKDSRAQKRTQPAPHVYCQVCGTRNDPASAFCMNCGASLAAPGEGGFASEAYGAKANPAEADTAAAPAAPGQLEYQGAANAAWAQSGVWQAPQWQPPEPPKAWQEGSPYQWGSPQAEPTGTEEGGWQPTQPMYRFQEEEAPAQEQISLKAEETQPLSPETASQEPAQAETPEEAPEEAPEGAAGMEAEPLPLEEACPVQEEISPEAEETQPLSPEAASQEPAREEAQAETPEEAPEGARPVQPVYGFLQPEDIPETVVLYPESAPVAEEREWAESVPGMEWNPMPQPAAGWIRCAICGAPLPGDARFCSECGAAVRK